MWFCLAARLFVYLFVIAREKEEKNRNYFAVEFHQVVGATLNWCIRLASTAAPAAATTVLIDSMSISIMKFNSGPMRCALQPVGWPLRKSTENTHMHIYANLV